ncbi:MAG: Gldg family protein [Rhodospirillaceae bacterium]|nr:Gldg family protein [Rhodospirillaceae bacterium]
MTNTDKNRLAVIAVAIAAVLFLAVNIISQTLFSATRVDVTEGRVFTLSVETIPVFRDIEEPIIVRVYFSQALSEASPRHAVYFQRISDLLSQYSALSSGMLQIKYFDPEPFSDVEDRAVGFGLQAVPLGNLSEVGYFGLAATNSTDDQEVIPFFNLEREAFIEYDLTKLVFTLSNPDQPKIGLITSLPVDGGMTPGMGGMQGTPTPPWQIMNQMRDFFEVERLDMEIEEIGEDVDVLVLAQPDGLSEVAAYTIDQWVLAGGQAIVFVDPNLESGNNPAGGIPGGAGDIANAKKLIEAWGLSLEEGVVAGDLRAAVRVNTATGSRAVISDYPAWLNLQADALNSEDAITGDLKNVTLATAGVLNALKESGLDVRPLIQTGVDSQKIAAEDVVGLPDVVAMFREFEPSGERLLLAARVTGPAKTAFPDGPPDMPANPVAEDEEEGAIEPMHLSESTQPIQVIVVSDADMLADRFWVQISNFLGQSMLMPTADNAAFLINALENLTGTPALSSLRGRGQISRPFTVVEDLRVAAEQKFRAKETELLGRLEALQNDINAIEVQQDGEGKALISGGDQRAITNYRGEILSTRKELREVQRALREEIDQLEGLTKFINIAGIPIVFGILLIVATLMRRRRIASAS